MKMIQGKIFLSAAEVAQAMGVSPRTVLRWYSKKSSEKPPVRLSPIKDFNGRLLFRKEEVDKLVTQILAA